MKKLIQLPRFPELKPLPVMKCVFDELTDAFKDYGCEIKNVYSFSELEDGGIIFLDDSGGNYINNRDIYIKIGEKCPNTVFICWYWKDISFRPFHYMIYTGEYYIYKDKTSQDIINYMSLPNFVPLKLRANDSPDKIGLYQRHSIRDYCFMGGGYKMDWIPYNFTGIYHRVIWDNYLPYSERRNIYLTSTFAFGFQSDDNIKTGHLSQRIFEGLAYGCIVLCENPLASEFTDGIVIHITSKDDLIAKMKYYKEHPELIIEKQKKGYEWVKKYGTNRQSIILFLDKIKELYNKNFNTNVVSVNIMGGLGNQLFQVASAYAYARKEDGILQIYNKKENGNRPVYWDSILKRINPYLVEVIDDSLIQWYESGPTDYTTIGKLDSPGKYLNGYLQSSKYFYNDKIKQEIKQLFKPDIDIMSDVYKKYKKLIINHERVIVIHARRTDYLKYSDIHGPLDSAYYKEAVNRIILKIANPIFVLCSDDNNYWNEIRNDISIVFDNEYYILENESDINTFGLLQLFHNFIMSNSTFIWWCVWLSEANHVIVPSKWFGYNGPKNYEDIYENTWERI